MRGHVYKRSPNGRSWTIVYDVEADPVTGRRRQRSQAVKGTKREAERVLREILLSIEQGTYVKANKVTVGEWLRTWVNDHASMTVTERTLESYRSIVERHLIPSLGGIPLTKLSPMQMQEHYGKQRLNGRADKKGGLSNRSIAYQHRILCKSLDVAVKMGLAVKNAGKLVEPPRVPRVTMNTLSPEEVLRFLDAAKDTDYYVYFATLLYTGLRRGELLALRWRNLDLRRATLTVVETGHKLSDGRYIIKEPKTPQSRRTVSLPASLVELFKAYRADQELWRIHLEVSLDPDDFVFIRPDGRPINPNAVTLAFRRVIKKGGLKHVRVHDLRHTHATLMLKAGVHPKVVSERLGHANIGITLDTYSHVLPGLQEAAAEKFEDAIEGRQDTAPSGLVSKMLAGDTESRTEPGGIRTRDTLIKSQVLFH